MYRGTTPTIVFTINEEELDLTTIKEVWITFRLLGKNLTFTKKDVSIDPDDKTITLNLTQEDTLKFNKKNVDVQLRILLDDDSSYASAIKNVTVNDILQDGVITAGE